MFSVGFKNWINVDCLHMWWSLWNLFCNTQISSKTSLVFRVNEDFENGYGVYALIKYRYLSWTKHISRTRVFVKSTSFLIQCIILANKSRHHTKGHQCHSKKETKRIPFLQSTSLPTFHRQKIRKPRFYWNSAPSSAARTGGSKLVHIWMATWMEFKPSQMANSLWIYCSTLRNLAVPAVPKIDW